MNMQLWSVRLKQLRSCVLLAIHSECKCTFTAIRRRVLIGPMVQQDLYSQAVSFCCSKMYWGKTLVCSRFRVGSPRKEAADYLIVPLKRSKMERSLHVPGIQICMYALIY